MATDVTMGDDMQIDFTMDEQDPEILRLQAEADAINAHANEAADSAMVVTEAPEEGEVDSSAPAPTKIHVRGLNQLNTFDIEAWVKEHEQGDLFKRVQWVDDSSANLIFDTEIAAAEALNALAAEEAMDPLQLRAGKRLSTHPDAELQVRQAILADVKAPKAKERSAFYLFNKDWDPDNPDNIRPDRKRKRYDSNLRSNKLRRRDHARERETPTFNEDMYDDDPDSLARRQSHSSDPNDPSKRHRSSRPGEDLMDDRRGGRLRDRSASPLGESDGRYGFTDDQTYRRTARARSFTPPAARSNRAARDSLRKELFPDRPSGQASALTSSSANGHSASSNGYGSGAGVPSTPGPNARTRELFPDRTPTPAHRRQDAQDLHPDEVARAIGQYTLDGASADLHDYRFDSEKYRVGSVGHHRSSSNSQAYSSSQPVGRRPSDRSNSNTGKDLFSRVEGGPRVESRHGRLGGGNEDEGFSIKGANAGFSILGASRERVENPLVKELFPIRSGGSVGNSAGAGKDLFDGRIKGRGAFRRKAEDLF